MPPIKTVEEARATVSDETVPARIALVDPELRAAAIPSLILGTYLGDCSRVTSYPDFIDCSLAWSHRLPPFPEGSVDAMLNSSGMEKQQKRPLWTSPRCGQKFVIRNIWHSCSSFTVEDFFRKKAPAHKKLYRAFLKLVRKCGPVKVNVNKSRISFQARVRFAGIPRVTKDGLVGGFLA